MEKKELLKIDVLIAGDQFTPNLMEMVKGGVMTSDCIGFTCEDYVVCGKNQPCRLETCSKLVECGTNYWVCKDLTYGVK